MNEQRKRKRVPLWLAQLRMYQHLIARPHVTVAQSAQFIAPLLLEGHVPSNSLQCGMGERDCASGVHSAREAFERLKGLGSKL